MSNMNKIKIQKQKDFTVVDNWILKDKKISLKARGLYVTVMGLSDDWDLSLSGLEVILKEGKDAIRTAMRELMRHKYVIRESYREPETGRLKGVTYTFYERPPK